MALSFSRTLSIIVITILISSVVWLTINKPTVVYEWGVDLQVRWIIPISLLLLLLLNIQLNRLIRIALRTILIFISLFALLLSIGSEFGCIDLGLSCPLLTYTNILKPLFLFLLIVSFVAKKKS